MTGIHLSKTPSEPTQPDPLALLKADLTAPNNALGPDLSFVHHRVVGLMRSPGPESWWTKEHREHPKSDSLTSPFCECLELVSRVLDLARFAPGRSELGIWKGPRDIDAINSEHTTLRQALNRIIISDQFRPQELRYKPDPNPHLDPKAGAFSSPEMEDLYQSWADRRLEPEHVAVLSRFREIVTDMMDMCAAAEVSFFRDEQTSIFHAGRSDYLAGRLDYIDPMLVSIKEVLFALGQPCGLSQPEIRTRYPRIFNKLPDNPSGRKLPTRN